MKFRLYQVDAFTDKLFGGNPAAVVPLESWLSDERLQNIAMENNLSETAFFVEKDNGYHIRWFTPTDEVDLCGHATLASSFVIFNFLDCNKNEIIFDSLSGMLKVTRSEDLITLDFPSRIIEEIEPNSELIKALPVKPSKVLFNKSTVAVFENEEVVRSMKPDIKRFLNWDTHGVIITSKGNEVDFVSRFFAPDVGIDEDPVTGYAHTLLTPYWSKELNKKKLHAKQVSKRGGDLIVEDCGARIKISGKAVIYFQTEFEL
ncbi:MAG: PhzF family phenazine biosynthesis protein [Melioribacteraceae bacterium]|nr:PhzF family phenazine biosynthesis protein [Melioribacteraceae bacterium]MCF8353578.1 PhzF family phenazine biosynthesis protein [Melioribacteraceae bacterium]MCF8393501.1 PhzF family phenazine biosynthesis protein [Melioribacteraceae bacterium]MCF8419311.1 PhzF family phenazine biosynthesis protein [Melioribacteraceae bacterium]